MRSESLVSWLIHSDWYLIAGWVLVLAIAVLVTFTDLALPSPRGRKSKDHDASL